MPLPASDILAVTALTASGPGLNPAGAGVVGAGQTVTITLVADEAMWVTGTPTLTLNDGGVATYLAGNGSASLTFTYLVKPGDNTGNLAITGLSGLITDDAVDPPASGGPTQNPAIHTLSTADILAVGLPSGLQIKTTAPTAPVISGVVGQPVNGQAIEVRGSGESGETVKLYVDGGSVAVGTGVVTNGVFDIVTSATFADGQHSLVATETDGAGLTSAAGAAVTVAVAPSAPVISGVVGQPVNGQAIEVKGSGESGETVKLYADGGTVAVGTGVVTNGVFDIITSATFGDGLHSLVATETDGAGLTSAAGAAVTVAVAPTAPVISGVVGQPVNGQAIEVKGSGESGETVRLYADGGTVAVGTGVVANGVFDIVTTATFADGLHSLVATETDGAGLTSAAGAAVTVAVAPSAPVISGLVGGVTAGQPIELKGAGSNGDTVNIYVDGGSLIIGSQIVSNGAFDIVTTASFTTGTHSLTAVQIDGSKLSSAPSIPFSLSIGLTSPTIGSIGVQQGATPTLTVSGTGVSGDTVTLYGAGVSIGSGPVVDGRFSIVSSQSLAPGLQSLTAIQTTASGQTSGQSPGFMIDVLSKGVNNLQAPGPITFIAQTTTLSNGSVITPSGAPNYPGSLIYLSGAGTFNLSLPTALTNIVTVTGQEYSGSSIQTVTLRNNLNLTLNVNSAAGGSIKIIGAANNDVINLGAGTDVVVIGGPGEVVNGGGGTANITATAALAGALITTHGGVTNLSITGGGAATLNSGDTGPMNVTLANLASGAWTFTANNQAGLVITDLSSTADTLIAGGAGETLVGGLGKQILVGFGSGVTTYKDTLAAFKAGATIQNFVSTDLVDVTNLAFAQGLTLSETRVSSNQVSLTIMSGSLVKAQVVLFGQIAASSFALCSDGASGTLISATSAQAGAGLNLAVSPSHVQPMGSRSVS